MILYLGTEGVLKKRISMELVAEIMHGVFPLEIPSPIFLKKLSYVVCQKNDNKLIIDLAIFFV